MKLAEVLDHTPPPVDKKVHRIGLKRRKRKKHPIKPIPVETQPIDKAD